MTENDGLPLDLFGEPDIPGTAADPGVLAREITEPPLTTLDTRTGRWRARAAQCIDAMREAGVGLYSDAVIINAHGSLQLVAARTMQSTRKLTRLHQYLIVGVKGDPGRAAQRLRGPS